MRMFMKLFTSKKLNPVVSIQRGFSPLVMIMVVGGLLVLLGIGYFVYPRLTSLKSGESLPTVACTQEAKICPDGSTVTRTLPRCEFAACPYESTKSAPPDLMPYTRPLEPEERLP